MHSNTILRSVDQRQSRTMGNPKRFAAYFPSKASLYSKYLDSDNESTWEFSASEYPPSRSSSATSCSTSGSTPAQEIVIRYRSRNTGDFGASRTSRSPRYSEATSADASSSFERQSDFDYVPLALDAEAYAVRRVSRDAALLSTVSTYLHFPCFIGSLPPSSIRRLYKWRWLRGLISGLSVIGQVAATRSQVSRR